MGAAALFCQPEREVGREIAVVQDGGMFKFDVFVADRKSASAAAFLIAIRIRLLSWSHLSVKSFFLKFP